MRLAYTEHVPISTKVGMSFLTTRESISSCTGMSFCPLTPILFFVSNRFGADPAKRAHIIRQMNLSVQLLRENGTKEWSLPSFDKRTYDKNHSDDDTSDDDTSDSRGSNNDSALDNPLQQPSPVAEGLSWRWRLRELFTLRAWLVWRFSFGVVQPLLTSGWKNRQHQLEQG